MTKRVYEYLKIFFLSLNFLEREEKGKKKVVSGFCHFPVDVISAQQSVLHDL